MFLYILYLKMYQITHFAQTSLLTLSYEYFEPQGGADLRRSRLAKFRRHEYQPKFTQNNL